jgi:hypothetical protein
MLDILVTRPRYVCQLYVNTPKCPGQMQLLRDLQNGHLERFTMALHTHNDHETSQEYRFA